MPFGAGLVSATLNEVSCHDMKTTFFNVFHRYCLFRIIYNEKSTFSKLPSVFIDCLCKTIREVGLSREIVLVAVGVDREEVPQSRPCELSCLVQLCDTGEFGWVEDRTVLVIEEILDRDFEGGGEELLHGDGEATLRPVDTFLKRERLGSIDQYRLRDVR